MVAGRKRQEYERSAQPGGLWGLPEEGVVAIVVGFFRKDVAIGLLAPL